MKNIVRTTVLSLPLMVFLSAKSQIPISTDVVGKLTIAKASITNLKNMLQMSYSDWESSLAGMGYGYKNLSGDAVSLSKGSTMSGGIHRVTKSASTIAIGWYHSGNSNTVLDNLIEQLRPFYKGLNEGHAVYQQKDGDIIYQFVISRDNAGEYVIMNTYK
jgi:hypothetical protein